MRFGVRGVFCISFLFFHFGKRGFRFSGLILIRVLRTLRVSATLAVKASKDFDRRVRKGTQRNTRRRALRSLRVSATLAVKGF